MWNLVFDFPDKNYFIFIDSCVCIPIQISHCVEFTSFCSGSPCSEKWTMNFVNFHKMLNHFNNLKEMIFNIIDNFLILNMSDISDELVKQCISNIIAKIPRVRRYNKGSLEKKFKIVDSMNFSSSIFNSFKLVFEAIRYLKANIRAVLPIKEHFQKSSFPSSKSCTGKENIVCFYNLFSQQACIIVSNFVMCSYQFYKFIRSLILKLINVKLIQCWLSAFTKNWLWFYLANCISDSVRLLRELLSWRLYLFVIL